MADRFPSLDELGDQPAPTTSTPAADSDDFLARERAVLGDDADQFISANDHMKTPTVEDAEDDLLGAGEQHQGMDEETAGFESSFPALESQNEQVAPGGTITGANTFQRSFSTYQEPEEESEAVREWRTKRDEELSRRAAISSERKAATIKKAQEDIDDYYESYNKRADKAKERTRADAEEFLANREDTAAGGTSWERIAKLVDVSGKGIKGGASGSGKERFRELLMDLKKDQSAPGVSGL
ncbi:Clathrin light chain [Ophidiomyces ophidiicola]|uniref:Clathrin light chain n=1 Tax=Ophidiomyces ophidiicola TaxID=1387563 RepID=A0ACB8V5W4_9EURO|nr:Clathrin light chain [Ophidiomyces ophidiicola]KAI1925607.1 Clathrin light chain [Ophidiomyces ophidiicola]KAI2148026.1 Clathrin light chain [Ophidiomyces ophidiicola]KAI2193888.1 Clathrin light chain [Ophidiomyces ophidiicola]KAI2383580.1 Clathrin light chain [Ophidiomyces ophidiicola]